jgi:hypothetical protein
MKLDRLDISHTQIAYILKEQQALAALHQLC